MRAEDCRLMANALTNMIPLQVGRVVRHMIRWSPEPMSNTAPRNALNDTGFSRASHGRVWYGKMAHRALCKSTNPEQQSPRLDPWHGLGLGLGMSIARTETALGHCWPSILTSGEVVACPWSMEMGTVFAHS